jgi:hypothetical protein
MPVTLISIKLFICCHHYHDGTGGGAFLLLAILRAGRRTPFPSPPRQWVAHYPRFRSILGDQLDGGREEDKRRKNVFETPALVKEECMFCWFSCRVAAASQPEKKATVVG